MPIKKGMSRIIDTLTDQKWRYRMGRRFEAMTDEIFQVIRWVLMVGFADYLAHLRDSLILDLTYWGLSALLFGYIASRFLLRPEIPFLGHPVGRLARFAQSGLNFLLCIVVFAIVLCIIANLTETIATHRGAL
ncbi:hypothetical protein RA2_03657 [Roseovarius sp. A-2]|uniref:hypothetical protein n=1 Tax=Roseovarius sp. A-2 TaxID=1570360 RepID=UPI0009B51DE7|nr:hypothetical protein [Roseovarius sp. A-2]GAW36584.1 hypothetical protein RA2_03657 [Roseovarius sp. A-2]